MRKDRTREVLRHSWEIFQVVKEKWPGLSYESSLEILQLVVDISRLRHLSIMTEQQHC